MIENAPTVVSGGTAAWLAARLLRLSAFSAALDGLYAEAADLGLDATWVRLDGINDDIRAETDWARAEFDRLLSALDVETVE